MKSHFTALLIFLSVLLSGNSVYCQFNEEAVKIENLLLQANELGVFNGNVLVAKQGKIIYRKAIGKADAKGAEILTTDYRFHIGSIAKEFNAVGIMMLEEEGRLSLDDNISKYLPELPAWASKVKIRHLLQYTSGIPQSRWKEVMSDADNMGMIKSMAQLNFEPGTKYDYNNNDVFLQRRIIEKISGLSFETFVQKKMLRPQGIKKAVVDPAKTAELFAKAFNNDREPDEIIYNISGWTALNLDDFYKWSESLNNFKIISTESTAALLIPFAPGKQTGLGKGKMAPGVMLSHTHDGTFRNYQALLEYDASSGITIILMTNNKQNNLGDISTSIKSIMNGKPYLPVKRSFMAAYLQDIEKMDGAQILALYEATKAKSFNTYGFDREATLNDIGYLLIKQGKKQDAVLVFSHNAGLFPTSANVFDSLGEGYMLVGDKAKALESYKKALALDPQLESSKKMVEELSR